MVFDKIDSNEAGYERCPKHWLHVDYLKAQCSHKKKNERKYSVIIYIYLEPYFPWYPPKAMVYITKGSIGLNRV